MADTDPLTALTQRFMVLELRAAVDDWLGRRFVYSDIPLSAAWPLEPQLAHRCDDLFLDRETVQRVMPQLLPLYEETDQQMRDIQDVEPQWKGPSDYSDLLSDDYNPEDEGFGIEDVAHDIDEELTVIQKRLTTAEETAGIAPAPGRALIRQGLRNEATAYDLWRAFAIPYRRKGERVYFVQPSHWWEGEHQMRSMHVDDFLVQVAYRTASNRVEIQRLSRHLDAWRAVAVIMILIGLLVLVT